MLTKPCSAVIAHTCLELTLPGHMVFSAGGLINETYF